MKRTIILFLGTSFFIAFAAVRDGEAKSPKSNHGVAFNQGKQEAHKMANLETSSGEGEVPLPVEKLVAPPPIETSPTAAPVKDCARAISSDSAPLFSFYYAANAHTEKIPSGLKVNVEGGALQYGGGLYHLKSIEISATKPLEVRLFHENDLRNPLVVVAPVVAAENSNAAFEFLLGHQVVQYFDINAVLPASRDYRVGNGGCDNSTITLVLKQPVELSLPQIEKFKSTF